MTQQSEENEKLTSILKLVNESEISSIRNILSRIIGIINDPNSTANDLKEVIQIDPPLAAKVLRLANSAYFSPRSSIGEIQGAIIWVGYDAIRELALSQKVCEIFNTDDSFEGFSRIALWKHSLSVAILSKLILRREFGEKGESAYIAGLLHDMGQIVEDQFCHRDFKAALVESRNKKVNLIRTEREFLGYDHTEVGRVITRDWKIPEELSVAIESHHNPQSISKEFQRISYVLYVADQYCQQKGIGYGDAPFEDKDVFNQSLELLGLKSHALELLIKDVRQEISKMEDQGFF